MNQLDETTLNDLQTVLEFANPDLVRMILSGTHGDLASMLRQLKDNLAEIKNSNKFEISKQNAARNNGPETSISINMDTALTTFENLEEIQDPDLKFALELQREEIEQEKRLKQQQDEDSLFAIRLQQEGNDQTENNFVFQQNPSTSQTIVHEKIKDEESERQTVTIDDDDDKTCVVCLDIERNAIFAPCAHRVCCVKCAKQILVAKHFCPLCWTNLDGVIECQNITHK